MKASAGTAVKGSGASALAFSGSASFDYHGRQAGAPRRGSETGGACEDRRGH